MAIFVAIAALLCLATVAVLLRPLWRGELPELPAAEDLATPYGDARFRAACTTALRARDSVACTTACVAGSERST